MNNVFIGQCLCADQVLQERAETGSRHGRATFSILLLQDLAVVVVLMLIPLLSNKNSASGGGLDVIMKALSIAAIKAVICITGMFRHRAFEDRTDPLFPLL